MKNGDRVIVNGIIDGINFHHEKGIIISDRPNLFLIEFDNYMNGHTGEGDGKDGHCWFVNKKYIKLEDNISDFKKELDSIVL